MALEDKDIFMAICQRFGDQPIEFVMEQYEKAKKINLDIEKRLGMEQCACVAPQAEIVVEEAPQEEVPPKKKYTRRSLVVKPQEAIGDLTIKCCICGSELQSLTSKHLAAHDITVEEYKKLCGYAPDQPLMSRHRLAKSREIIVRAQRARIDKRAAMQDD